MTAQGAILVVDDEQFIRQILLRTVLRAGFTADEASDGKEALEKMSKQSFDIVITDIEMPNMDGFELLAGIRELYPDTLVIFITGHKRLVTKSSTGDHRPDAVISKPFHNVEISRQLRLLYQNHRRQMAAAEGETGPQTGESG